MACRARHGHGPAFSSRADFGGDQGLPRDGDGVEHVQHEVPSGIDRLVCGEHARSHMRGEDDGGHQACAQCERADEQHQSVARARQYGRGIRHDAGVFAARPDEGRHDQHQGHDPLRRQCSQAGAEHAHAAADDQYQVEHGVQHRAGDGGEQGDADLLQSAEDAVGRVDEQHARNAACHGPHIDGGVVEHGAARAHHHAERPREHQKRQGYRHADREREP